ncbi:hypothetical protein [Streptomyces erythrochromogenes]|uniref:hypothetical protein n=1 Tax=Streptomyces erythrochromogenes TaxID=285574 RepID=UPI0038695B8B|nr:hypothetical protein OG364_29530 [Streptomyces erythrochromogenes]
MNRLPSAAETETARVLRAHPGKWMSSRDVHARTPAIAPRTVRAGLARLLLLGVAECVTLRAAHHYRLTAAAIEEHADYLARVDQAAELLTARTQPPAPTT